MFFLCDFFRHKGSYFHVWQVSWHCRNDSRTADVWFGRYCIQVRELTLFLLWNGRKGVCKRDQLQGKCFPSFSHTALFPSVVFVNGLLCRTGLMDCCTIPSSCVWLKFNFETFEWENGPWLTLFGNASEIAKGVVIHYIVLARVFLDPALSRR